MAVSLVIGNMIGSGIFFLPSALARYGSISIFGWLVSAAGAIAVAFTFIRLSRQYQGISGGPYVYSRKGFGNLIGFLMGWAYFIATILSLAGIAAAFVGYLGTLLPIIQNSFWGSLAVGLGVTWLLAWINSTGIRNGGSLQVITTILKLTPLILIIIGGLFYLDVENFKPFQTTDDSIVSVLAATAMLTAFAFVGLESATIPAGNIKNPEKNVAKATLIGISVTTVVYITATVALLGLLSSSALASSEAPFSDAAGKIWGPNASYVVSLGVVISTFGALNGWILICGQLLSSIANDKLLPPFFNKLNKNGAPANSLFFACALASAMMMMSFSDGLVSAFEFLVTISVVLTLIPYVTTSGTALKNTWRNPEISQTVKILRLVAPTLALLFSVWLIADMSINELLWSAGLLFLGLPFYYYNKHNRNK